MNNITGDKDSITYSNDDLPRGGGGNRTSALPVHAYVHNAVPQPREIANPGPLGLFSFAGTIFILSMYNVRARGITVPNAVIGMACFAGGLSQFIAGMWEFTTGNLFGASAFSCYGGFWLAYAAILHPAFGVSAAYAKHPGQLANAIGIFLASWFILTFIFFLATLRTNLVSIVLFFLLGVTYLTLMISQFTGSLITHKVGGWVGLADAAVAFYAGAAQLLNEDNFWFTLPVGTVHRRRRFN